MPKKKPRLSRDDWIDAALDSISEGGLGSVAVERLAESLGVTKGSFYWHFRDLDALIEAALARWAVERTKSRIDELEAIAEPRKRLSKLLTPRGRDIDGVDQALAVSLGDPRVRRFRKRHDRLWLEFAERAFSQMGCTAAEARHRATLAYTSYLGLVSLSLSDPSVTTPRRFAAYARFLRRLFTQA